MSINYCGICDAPVLLGKECARCHPAKKMTEKKEPEKIIPICQIAGCREMRELAKLNADTWACKKHFEAHHPDYQQRQHEFKKIADAAKSLGMSNQEYCMHLARTLKKNSMQGSIAAILRKQNPLHANLLENKNV